MSFGLAQYKCVAKCPSIVAVYIAMQKLYYVMFVCAVVLSKIPGEISLFPERPSFRYPGNLGPRKVIDG